LHSSAATGESLPATDLFGDGGGRHNANDVAPVIHQHSARITRLHRHAYLKIARAWLNSVAPVVVPSSESTAQAVAGGG